MIRARRRQHLENLQQRFPDLTSGNILISRETDYPYRIIVPKHRWVSIARDLANDIDYHNFKNKVAKECPDMLIACHDVHELMWRDSRKEWSYDNYDDTD